MTDQLRIGRASALPERVRSFQGHRAGVVTRVMAAVINVVVVAFIVAALYLGVAGIAFAAHPARFHWPSWLGWSLPVIGFVVVVPYLTFCWTTAGRTVGDSLLGLRVVNHTGETMSVPAAAARAVTYVIFPIGLLWVAISPGNRSVQDLVFRTSVIYAWTRNVSLFDRDTGIETDA
jgi:uncharacterized RDD family membrane protein YckC